MWIGSAAYVFGLCVLVFLWDSISGNGVFSEYFTFSWHHFPPTRLPHSALIWAVMPSIVARYATVHWYPVSSALFSRRNVSGEERRWLGRYWEEWREGRLKLVCNVWKKNKEKERKPYDNIFVLLFNKLTESFKKILNRSSQFFQLKQWW